MKSRRRARVKGESFSVRSFSLSRESDRALERLAKKKQYKSKSDTVAAALRLLDEYHSRTTRGNA